MTVTVKIWRDDLPDEWRYTASHLLLNPELETIPPDETEALVRQVIDEVERRIEQERNSTNRGDRAKFEAALSKVADTEPDEQDRL